jgi:hypothetical protein
MTTQLGMMTGINGSTPFALTRDINGYNGFGLPFSKNNFKVILQANAAQSFTVPSNAQNWIVIFSIEAGSKVWVDPTTTAAIPTSTIGASTSVLNPTGRQVSAGTVISMITGDTTAQVCVSLYVLL